MYLIVAVVIVIAPMIDELLMLGGSFWYWAAFAEGGLPTLVGGTLPGCHHCPVAATSAQVPSCWHQCPSAQFVACIVFNAAISWFWWIFSRQRSKLTKLFVWIKYPASESEKEDFGKDAALCYSQPSGKSKSETFSAHSQNSWVIMDRISLVQCRI